MTTVESKPITVIVQLGRNGDLLNLLPLFYKDFLATGEKTHLIVAKEYAPLLDGVSYVEPHIFEGHAHEIDKACEFAGTFAQVLRVAQVLGPPDLVKKYVFEPMNRPYAVTESFQKESWLAIGRFHEWREQLPLVFDKRDTQREQELFARYKPHPKKKLILVHADGQSSPFPYKELLLELVRLKFTTGFQVLNLAEVKAERFYDLLVLMEHAHCLIAIDSAPLHLAYATHLPVVALVNDKPVLWNGSVWRPNHICHIRYSDFPKRAAEMLRAVDTLQLPGMYPCWRPVAEDAAPRIIHTWSTYDLIEESIKSRHENAKDLWEEQYQGGDWIRCPIEVGAIGRDSRTDLKDSRRFPFVKDVLRIAAQRARDTDILCITRSDIGFTVGKAFDEAVLSASENPIYSHRWVWGKRGREYSPQVDLFAFTKAWWREHQSEYPDFVMGLDPYWHQVLKDVLVRHGGKEVRYLVHREPGSSTPKKGDTVSKYVGRNEDLRVAYFKKHEINSLYPKIGEQAQTHVINRRALSSGGYNGSIVRFNNRLLLAYRFHDESTPATSLMIAELDQRYDVIANRPIEIPGASIEDPRLFILRGALYICYVDSTWPETPSKSVVRYARLVEGASWKLEEIHQPKLEGNDGTSMQKNYMMFSWQDRLMCVSHTSPEQIVHELQGPNPINEWKSETPHWPWGNIRGGTTPIPYKGSLLRFVHTRLDNEAVPYFWRYYAAACICETEPPFQITSISKEPMLYGSESDELTDMERAGLRYYKKNVIFPMGAIEHNEGWLLSAGINDSSVGLIQLHKEHLKL